MAFKGYLKQSTAVDVMVGPFVDDTDGKTAETGLTIAQADVRLSKNGANMAQKNEATTLTHDEIGIYLCKLDATDTATLGLLTLDILESGALSVSHSYMVINAHWWDTMCSTDYLHVDVKQIEGADPTDTIRDSVVDDATRLDASSLNAVEGKLDTVDGIVDNILIDTAVIGALGAGLTAVPWNSAWDTEVQSECADALTAYDPPTKTEMDTAHALLATPANVATELATYDGPTKTEMDTAHALLATEAKQDVIDGIVDNILIDTAVIGALGAGLTAIPWNAAWDTEVESEVNDALVALNLDHLCKQATVGADMTAEVVDNSILSRIIGSGDTSTFDPTTDALQDIRDKLTDIEADTQAIETDTNELQGDWTDAGRLDAILDLILADTGELQTDWADAGRLDALIDLILADTGELQTDWADGGRLDLILDAAGGAGDPWITALPGAYGAGTAGKIIGDNINAPIGTVDTVVDGIQTDLSNVTDGLGALKALIDAIPTTAMRGTDNVVLAGPTKAEMDTAHALLATEAKQDIIDTILDKLDSALELDGAVYRYTTNALEQAPGGASAASIADAVWNEAYTGHESANTFGRIVSAIMGEWEITGNQLICKGLGDTVLFTYNLSQDGNPTEFNPDKRDPV